VRKRTDSPGSGSLTSAALTALSTLLVTAFAAVVGVIMAREFGRTEETDGFFAAYGVFVVIVLAAQAIRVAMLPALARARGERRLAGAVAGFATALAVVGVPLLLVGELAAAPIADLLTGSGSAAAQDACAEALRWMIPAAVFHLFAGLAASGLAALDDYATAALGYAAGSAAGLALILTRVDSDGLVAVSRGMALNGLVALLVPSAGLGWRAARARMPAGAVRPSGPPLASRLGVFGAAVSLPLALQLLYVVCLPFAGREGVGGQTSFGYAYVAASALVATTASSLGLVTSVPLTRAGLGPAAASRHVVSVSWIALCAIGAGAGIFALAGGTLVEGALGGAYGGDVGEEVARLVVVFSFWMVASVGVSVTFPLVFVLGRTRLLPWIGLAALGLQVLLAFVGQKWLGLDGLAVALAVSTLFVFVALLRQLHALRATLRGVAVGALELGGIALLAFAPFAVVSDSPGTAILGLGAYVVVLALLRPRRLGASWRYLRALS